MNEVTWDLEYQARQWCAWKCVCLGFNWTPPPHPSQKKEPEEISSEPEGKKIKEMIKVW